MGRSEAQTTVDKAVKTMTSLIHDCFGKSHLVRRRKFGGSGTKAFPIKSSAPPELRRARNLANGARQQYLALLKCGAHAFVVAKAKTKWNAMSARCRKLAQLRNLGLCLD
eukprot:147678-Karenia_brevis.AAC.1